MKQATVTRGRVAVPIEVRFWPKVQKTDGCWLWTAGRDKDGYGQFRVHVAPYTNRHVHAHRVAWELTYGPIPSGLCVCHRCDNPGCVRPDHLFLGTLDENNQDKVKKGRQSKGLETKPWLRAKGEGHPKAKLTTDDVRQIRARFSGGATSTELAAAYGVTTQAIRAIALRKVWRHVS